MSQKKHTEEQILSAGYVNGDSYADLVILGVGSGGLVDSVASLLAKGDGSFSLGSVATLAGLDCQQIALADFDGNGHADVAAGWEFFLTLKGRGDGTFGPPVTSPK